MWVSGYSKTQDKKRQEFFSLVPKGPDVLSWWSSINNEGTDAGCSPAVIWERFLEYIPNADARYLRWDLDRYVEEHGKFPVNGQAFIIQKLNDSLGKCKVIFEPSKKTAVPKVYALQEGGVQKGDKPYVQQGKGTNKSPLTWTQAQCTVGYAGQNQAPVQKDNRYPSPVCNTCHRNRSDAKDCLSNFHTNLCYVCDQRRESPREGCRSNFHLTRPQNKSTEKQFCRLCGNNSHWLTTCFIYQGQIPVPPLVRYVKICTTEHFTTRRNLVKIGNSWRMLRNRFSQTPRRPCTT